MNENAIISRPHHGSKLFWDGKLRWSNLVATVFFLACILESIDHIHI